MWEKRRTQTMFVMTALAIIYIIVITIHNILGITEEYVIYNTFAFVETSCLLLILGGVIIIFYCGIKSREEIKKISKLP